MRKYSFLIFLTYSLLALSQDRGFKRVPLTANADIGTLYEANHALVIGNSTYPDGWPSLPGVSNDVMAVSKALEERGFHVIQAYDLSKSQMDSAFTNFISTYGTNPEAGLLFYFAGHGHTIQTNYGEKLG